MIRISRGLVWRGVCAGVLGAGLLSLGATLRAREGSVVRADKSPAAEEVAPGDAWWLAEAFAAERRDCDTVVGSGDSMLPLYRDRTVLVLQRIPYERLERGMTVVFFGDSGRMVAHVLVEKTLRGWRAQGAGNAERDRTWVRSGNYLGTVIKAYAPNPRVASVRTRPVPVANSGPTVAMRGFRPSPEVLLALAPARAE